MLSRHESRDKGGDWVLSLGTKDAGMSLLNMMMV